VLVSASLFGAGIASLWFLSGCLLVHAVTTPVDLAATTVVAAGKTAGAVVSTTGKVAAATVNAGGSVLTAAADGVDSAARLARTGTVTFVDAASGAVTRVPWQPGLTLAGAGAQAKIQAYEHAVAIVRAGRLVYSVSQKPDTSVALADGDVVRLNK
jgi:hypothetical protein